MEGFYRKQGGARELLTKKRMFSEEGCLFFREGEQEGFLSHKIASFSIEGDREGEGPRDRLPYWC